MAAPLNREKSLKPNPEEMLVEEFDWASRKTAPQCSFFFTFFLYYSTSFTESEVAGAFVRSLVGCDLPVPKMENETWSTCPGGTYWNGLFEPLEPNFTSLCLAIPRGTPGWSASDKCAQTTVVLQSAQSLSGLVGAAAILVSTFFTSSLGLLLIDSWGRKPMMLISFLAQFICCLCYFGMTAVGAPLSSGTVTGLYYGGCLLTSALGTFAPASSAMAVDGTEADSTERSTSLSLIAVVRGLSGMVSAAVGIYVLTLELADYSQVWAIYSVILLVQLLMAAYLLVETKPSFVAGAGPSQQNEIFAAWEIITGDKKLLMGVLFTALSGGMGAGAFAVLPGWTLGFLGMTQAEAALSSLVGAFMVIIGSAASAPLSARFGALWMVYGSTAGVSTGSLLIASGYVFRDWAYINFWFGWAFFLAFGAGIAAPAIATLLSSRVAPENQGKFFAAAGIGGNMIALFAILFFTQVLLTSQDQETYLFQMVFVWIFMSFCDISITCGWLYFWGCPSNTDEDETKLRPGGTNSKIFSTGGSRSGSRILSGTRSQVGEGAMMM